MITFGSPNLYQKQTDRDFISAMYYLVFHQGLDYATAARLLENNKWTVKQFALCGREEWKKIEGSFLVALRDN